MLKLLANLRKLQGLVRSRLIVGSLILVNGSQVAIAGDTVALTLSGRIEQQCSVAFAQPSLDLRDLTEHRSASTGFDLNCNSPFSLRLSSEQGGLKSAHNGATVGEFADMLGYAATLSLPLDNGAILRTEDCRSEDLLAGAACAQLLSGGQTALGKRAELDITWRESARPLIAGEYADVVRVTLGFTP